VTEEEIVFRNYEGHVFRYPLKAQPKRVASPEESLPLVSVP
jgi:hypothetical protein